MLLGSFRSIYVKDTCYKCVNTIKCIYFIGVYIEEVLNKWKGDYEKLEHNHTYIQWLVTFYLIHSFFNNSN